ncbi:MAG: hypothetical protein JXL80_14295 [Planctomycetes bacterium]|nr:hypothetical protein [Planctomycetota bacterium]
MKRWKWAAVALATVMVYSGVQGGAARASNELSLLVRLLSAIREVESYGGKKTHGDGGRSLGPYHISRAYWRDGCTQLKSEGAQWVPWDYDRWVQSEAESRRIVEAYFRRHASEVCPPQSMDDCQVLARRHNGGPTGDRKSATLKYWRRVHNKMQ